MTGPVTVAGLGPAGLDRIPGWLLERLLDPGVRVIVRTLRHPAAAELAGRRRLDACDDLYEGEETFDDVYRGIVTRVLGAAAAGPVVYAVPGSPFVGEQTVAMLREACEVEILAAESFLDLAMARLGFDPFTRGMQVLDGRDLPHPLLLHLPTFIGQIDTPLVLSEVRDALLRLLNGETEVVWLSDLGGSGERLERLALAGLVQTNTHLRRECPWDREQTHHSLATHLLEEAYETLEAIEALPAAAPSGEPDVAGYLDLEEELGDLLLQVVFHSVLAAEASMFGVEEVAEQIRRKLVRRHPHVFGDIEAETAERVKANWEILKREEKRRESSMDGVPSSLPALSRAHALQSRAARVGFDWPNLDGVIDKVREEIGELVADLDRPERAAAELGDLLFSVVNLARRIGADPEQALRAASARFERRFRAVEDGGTLAGLTLEELDRRWEAAKASETDV
jgi:tetrapyrrole methylase family protein/MazG family protein